MFVLRRSRSRNLAIIVSVTFLCQVLLFLKLSTNAREETSGADSTDRQDEAIRWEKELFRQRNASRPGTTNYQKKWAPADSENVYRLGRHPQDNLAVSSVNGSEAYSLTKVKKKITSVRNQFRRLKELESHLFTEAIGPETDSECILPTEHVAHVCIKDIRWKCNLAETFSHFDRDTSTIHIRCPGLVRVNFVERTEWELPDENGRYTRLPKWKYLEGPTSIPMKSTYADVVCKDENDRDIHNYHTQFIKNVTINADQFDKYLETKRREPSWKPLSVLVITLDSLSRAHAHRKCGLPKTMALLNQMYYRRFADHRNPGTDRLPYQAFLFNRLNALAGSTVLNLTPMFSGEYYDNIDEEKLKKALYAKNVHEWIWQYAAKRGYLTFYGIDNSSGMMGTRTPCKECHYQPPTLPHVEHGWMKHENKEVEANTWAGLCDGNHMLHEYLFNYTREFFQQDHPVKWAAIDLNAGHRAEEESVNQVDEDLAVFLKLLMAENPNLAVILMGDHGKAYHADLSHLGGYYETLLPFLSMILPSWIFDERPDIFDTLTNNQQRYMVHSDLHKTMKSLLHYPDFNSLSGMVAPQAKNLLTDVIQRNRSCEDAGFPSWSCVCGHMQKLDQTEWSSEHRMMVEIALKYVNDKHTQKSIINRSNKLRRKSSCLDLHFQKILHIFVNTNPSANSQWSRLYQITFRAVEKDTVWQAVLDDRRDIKQVKQLSLYQPFQICQDKNVPLQYCVCDHPTLNQ